MIDLHSHSTASDGALSPGELVRAAAADGVKVLALTDHDTVTGWAEAREAAAECGIELIPGVEVSCRGGDDSVHLLGLFIDPEDPALTACFDEVAERRRGRIQDTCKRLTAIGEPLTFEEVAAQSTGRSLGRPHVADALVHKGAVSNRQEAFDRYLGTNKPGYVTYPWKMSVAEAARLLHQAGGITSLAHARFLTQDRVPGMIEEAGIMAIEVYHPAHRREHRDRYLRLAENMGLMVTGGSDFHLRAAAGDSHSSALGSRLPEARYRELVAAANGRAGSSSVTSTVPSSTRAG